jgi:adenylylsulfate kinase
MSGAGKMTICRAVEPEVRTMDYPVQVLDGNEVRQNLSPDRGFSKADRDEK